MRTISSLQPLPPEVLSVRSLVADDSTVVELDGPVCAYTAGHLDAELARLVDRGHLQLVIDASRVRPLCTAGIDVLLAHEERCTAGGGDLVLRDLRPSARKVLDVLSLQHLAAPVTVA